MFKILKGHFNIILITFGNKKVYIELNIQYV